MKAVCTRKVRLNGLEFEPGEEYNFWSQAFTEVYNPGIHPRPARGYRIRYIRYEVTLPTHADNSNGKKEARKAYFYDYAYCIHHEWRDERGHATACFDDHFSICEQNHDATIHALKKPLWSGLPKKINEKPIELPKDLAKYMEHSVDEQMHLMFGGLSPDDWKFDKYVKSKTNGHEQPPINS